MAERAVVQVSHLDTSIRRQAPYFRARGRVLEPLVTRVVDLSSPIDSVRLLVVKIIVHGWRAQDLLDESYEIRRGLKIDCL